MKDFLYKIMRIAFYICYKFININLENFSLILSIKGRPSREKLPQAHSSSIAFIVVERSS